MQVQTEMSQSQWAVVQLFGHKTLAGLVSKDEKLGVPMLRVDVPATDEQPAFTQLFGNGAIYGITFVSEEVARKTANAVGFTPIQVYVPDLITKEQHEQEVMDLRRQITRLSMRRLPDNGGLFDEDGDEFEPVDF